MNPNTTKFFATCVAVLATGGSALAADINWDGGGGDSQWTTAANWVGDVLPGAGQSVQIGASGFTDVIVSSGNQTVVHLESGNSGTDLAVDGAGVSLTASADFNTAESWSSWTARNNGTLDVGNIRFGGSGLQLNAESGGTLRLDRVNGTTGSPTINVSGGSTLNIERWLVNNGSEATFNIDGFGNTVVFDLNGGSNTSLDPNNSSSAVRFDFTMGSDPVNALSTVQFAQGLNVDQFTVDSRSFTIAVDGSLNTASFGTEFVLIDAASITGDLSDINVELSNIAGQVTVDAASGDIILTVYGSIPEPTTFSLLFGGLLVLRYSRRFKSD